MRFRSVAVALVGAGALVAGPVVAAQAAPTYPPSAPAISLSADVVTPGQSVHVTGTGFLPASGVTMTWTGPGARGAVGRLPFGSRGLTADTSGVVGSDVTFQTLGQHTVSLLGSAADGSPLTLSATLVVEALGSGTGLAHTGTPVLQYAEIGTALLVIGAFVVLLVRRRRAGGARRATEEDAESREPVGTR